MSVRIVQNSFIGGELSPALYGRHDISAYFKGAASIENFIVQKTGGLRKRNGFASAYGFTTAHAAGIGDDARLVPYRYSRTDGGLLLITEELVSTVKKTRVSYLPKGTGFNTASALNSALLPAYIYPPSVKWMQSGDTIILSGETGVAAADGTAPVPASVSSVLINHPAKTLTVALYVVNAKPTTPYYLEYTEIGNFIGTVNTRTLFYAAYTATAGVVSEPIKMSVLNTNGEWPASTGLVIKVRIRPVSGVYPDEIIIAKRSGALYGELARLQNSDYASEASDSGGAYRQYEFRDQNHLPGTMMYEQTPMFPVGSSVASGCTAVFQQRLAFAGLSGDPFSVVFSKTGDFHTFHANRPVADDDPFRITLPSSTPATIRHAIGYRDSLLLFTDSGVWRVYGSQSEGFSPRTCRMDQLNTIGCAPYVKPVQTTNGVLFTAADERTVYEMNYDVTLDTIIPVERTILAEHLTEGRKIVSMTHQRWPESVVWCALDNGRILTLTYQPEHEVYGWAHHVLTGLTQTLIQLVSPGTVTGPVSDLVLLCAASNGAGATQCRIGALDAASYLDMAGGAIPGTLITLRPELPDRNVQGLPKNIVDCLIRVRNTSRIAVKSNAGGVDEMLTLPANGDPYTGNVKIMPAGLINDDGQMSVVSDSGPCEIQCVIWRTEF